MRILQEMVAGDPSAGARVGTGTRAKGRGLASRTPSRRPRSLSICTPSTKRRIRLDHARDPRGDVAEPARRTALERGLGDPALAAHLDPPRQRQLRIVGRLRSRARGWGASHSSQPAHGRRSSPPAPNGYRMGVRAREQVHVLDAQAHLLHRALELGHRSRLVHPGVHQHDPRVRPRSPRRCSVGPPARAVASAAAKARVRLAVHRGPISRTLVIQRTILLAAYTAAL